MEPDPPLTISFRNYNNLLLLPLTMDTYENEVKKPTTTTTSSLPPFLFLSNQQSFNMSHPLAPKSWTIYSLNFILFFPPLLFLGPRYVGSLWRRNLSPPPPPYLPCTHTDIHTHTYRVLIDLTFTLGSLLPSPSRLLLSPRVCVSVCVCVFACGWKRRASFFFRRKVVRAWARPGQKSSRC